MGTGFASVHVFLRGQAHLLPVRRRDLYSVYFFATSGGLAFSAQMDYTSRAGKLRLKGASAMKKALRFLKKELMLTLSAAAAAAALLVTPPTAQLLKDIDWRTLGTLLMMLCVLEGFKKENVLEPLVRLASRMRRMTALSLFLVFGVFFTSMFVTNDVSLIIFVPLTILLFRNGNKERYILPVISMENIAAIRGSLLTPFGSPQNPKVLVNSGQ